MRRQNIGLTLSDTMKPLIELSIEHYESLLKRASEDSPLYFRLKNAVKTHADTVAILCDLDEAEMLLQMAKHFCSDAIPQLKKRSDSLDSPDRVLNTRGFS
jgi:hypothetical protein